MPESISREHKASLKYPTSPLKVSSATMDGGVQQESKSPPPSLVLLPAGLITPPPEQQMERVNRDTAVSLQPQPANPGAKKTKRLNTSASSFWIRRKCTLQTKYRQHFHFSFMITPVWEIKNLPGVSTWKINEMRWNKEVKSHFQFQTYC